jgi:multidrug efflux pump subunit AcrA (membrane-fusion protein)
VPETSLKAVRMGGVVRIFLDADPERPRPGRVARIWPTANRQKATVEVRVRFDRLDEGLRPDMGVRAVFLPEGEEPGPALVEASPLPLPPGALVRREGASGVFVVEGDRARFRAGTKAEEGDRIVVDPPEQLADGDLVKAEEG